MAKSADALRSLARLSHESAPRRWLTARLSVKSAFGRLRPKALFMWPAGSRRQRNGAERETGQGQRGGARRLADLDGWVDSEHGPITLLRFPEGGLADVVYLEQLAAAVYLRKPAETGPYWSALNRLATGARLPSATPAILREILAQA
jgi:hypothetical protein